MNFRLRADVSKEAFEQTLKDKQKHVPNKTALFQGVIDAVMKASEDGEMIEWPVELVLKKKRE